MLGRAARWTVEQAAFLTVLLGLAAAFVFLLAESGRWRASTGAMAVVLLYAGGLRLVLPTSRAGLLAVRGRVVDTISCLLLGGVILAVDIRLGR